jgi:hypothetical protein
VSLGFNNNNILVDSFITIILFLQHQHHAIWNGYSRTHGR